ncbi:Uncharacterised protein [Vibrio cholerae]|nr:Uncharacterised protein [Vibrio cholerae]
MQSRFRGTIAGIARIPYRPETGTNIDDHLRFTAPLQNMVHDLDWRH